MCSLLGFCCLLLSVETLQNHLINPYRAGVEMVTSASAAGYININYVGQKKVSSKFRVYKI
jgi:hypothetical protein